MKWIQSTESRNEFSPVHSRLADCHKLLFQSVLPGIIFDMTAVLSVLLASGCGYMPDFLDRQIECPKEVVCFMTVLQLLISGIGFVIMAIVYIIKILRAYGREDSVVGQSMDFILFVILSIVMIAVYVMSGCAICQMHGLKECALMDVVFYHSVCWIVIYSILLAPYCVLFFSRRVVKILF